METSTKEKRFYRDWSATGHISTDNICQWQISQLKL